MSEESPCFPSKEFNERISYKLEEIVAFREQIFNCTKEALFCLLRIEGSQVVEHNSLFHEYAEIARSILENFVKNYDFSNSIMLSRDFYEYILENYRDISVNDEQEGAIIDASHSALIALYSNSNSQE